MKKFISFILFATLVMLVLIAGNTASAQRLRPETMRTVRPICPRVALRKARTAVVMGYHPRYFRHYNIRMQGRPLRRVRYS